jgi:hypothetical protein
LARVCQKEGWKTEQVSNYFHGLLDVKIGRTYLEGLQAPL